MKASDIREKLANYVRVAEEKKIRAIYTMLEDEIDAPMPDWDARFVKELEQRSKSFVEGSAITYSWEETKEAARKRARSSKKK